MADRKQSPNDERPQLTNAQHAYLESCAIEARSCWDAGSSTIRRLRTLEFIQQERVRGASMYRTTEKGRAWLAAERAACP